MKWTIGETKDMVERPSEGKYTKYNRERVSINTRGVDKNGVGLHCCKMTHCESVNES